MLSHKPQPSRFLPSYLRRSLYASIIMIAVMLLIAYSVQWIGTAPFLYWDERIQDAIFPDTAATHDQLLTIAIFITSFGSFSMSLIIALGAATLCWVFLRSKAYSFAILSSFTAMWVLNTLIKEILQRERPSLQHLVEAGGYSFPSGHAMISMGFYGMIFAIWAIERKIRERSLFLPCVLGALLIILIGLSRIYLGVHFPTDIVGGYIAGIIWLAFTVPMIYWRAKMQLSSPPRP
ncbi:phosphatase PAP2 family protein [Paenibacillus sp. SEL3]|uniref:Phosphatase PAP2 family protein n=1 Tax=Paenibacillus polymyxa TaxID=1406 RepID=A0A8I1LVV6_PAEPO|nr:MULTISPECIES: phosphatase PAP2 family protein [Paenibacillus]KAF6571275.1 phosphatase PAP2 family protein [Paenibacillus sp. EKM206P]KAF6586276.1 phosphatase PAP2 family protein [Paenibacillus sp. EKM205P]MBM0635423.1 phosphatase PAP2 family protein [Paenibacillus polymyxa]MBO3285576.1 phosphatase PAP2 family protein [Paenibacillus polymyxa]MBP1311342.1 undecaprenyl-diphosphatase [Paenibacillus sp. 1182]